MRPPGRRTGAAFRVYAVAAALTLSIVFGVRFLRWAGPPGEPPVVAQEVAAVTHTPPRTPLPPGGGPPHASPRARLQALLSAGESEAAVALYDRAYLTASASETESLRRALVDHASTLIQQRRLARSSALLSRYLALFYRDADAWFVLGQAYREAGLYRPAIEAFANAHLYEERAAVRRIVGLQLNWTISLYVQQLEEFRRPGDIVSLFSFLVLAQPDNPYHYLSLASAFRSVGRDSDALGHLAYVSQDASVGERAREMMDEILSRPAP